MEQSTYVEIFDHVLEQQQPAGCWTLLGRNWDVVMTGVVLKALASLHFRYDDNWPLQQPKKDGGVSLALRFLKREVADSKYPAACGEDIWDACQAMIALKHFGEEQSALRMVQQINREWLILFERECSNHGNCWCGPAYLAAIVDLLSTYEEHLPDKSFLPALAALVKMETINSKGESEGFKANISAPDIDIWTTALVLRTLCTLPIFHQRDIDTNQVERLSKWLLEQLEGTSWEKNEGEAPMYLARSLHGLQEARNWVSRETRRNIEHCLKVGNERITSYFQRRPRPIGDIKAYTAVIEYLASWHIPAPSGLLFHARRSLDSVSQSVPRLHEGGLRIAWLSDLHVAADDKNVPFSVNPVRGWAAKLMWPMSSPLAKHFQLRNVETILNRVQTIRPDHILVTGDLTNYAQSSQFDSVRSLFLGVQASITGQASQALAATLWTILPGNHDVTDEETDHNSDCPNLGRFFRSFGSTYESVRPRGDDPFPVIKVLTGRQGNISIRLIGLDSTVNAPVWKIGVNARGRIRDKQMQRLNEIVGPNASGDLTLIALHHHPVVIPHLVSDLEDHFLSLEEKDGRNLIKLSANTDVSAILHGHFHRFSSWSVLTPKGKHMSIIGSPAGTLNLPDTEEQFLELRESERETADGLQHGLALFVHRRNAGGDWKETFTGIFLGI